MRSSNRSMPRSAIHSSGHRRTAGISLARRVANVVFPEPGSPHSKISLGSGLTFIRRLQRTAARSLWHARATAPANRNGFRARRPSSRRPASPPTPSTATCAAPASTPAPTSPRRSTTPYGSGGNHRCASAGSATPPPPAGSVETRARFGYTAPEDFSHASRLIAAGPRLPTTGDGDDLPAGTSNSFPVPAAEPRLDLEARCGRRSLAEHGQRVSTLSPEPVHHCKERPLRRRG